MYIDLLIQTSIAVTIMTTLLYFVMMTNRREKEKREKLKEDNAQLSYMREYFERQINNLNEKLLSNDERWKEVNHLLLSYNPKVDNSYFKETKPVLSTFFRDMGINENTIKYDKKLVFILTPFLDEYQNVYTEINNICRGIGLKSIRGDEDFIRGNVFRYILERIISARLIIANIDGRNPNVMYELGIAQAIGKPTILIAKNLTDIPFDIKSNHIILYQNYEELKIMLLSTLSKLLIDDNV